MIFASSFFLRSTIAISLIGFALGDSIVTSPAALFQDAANGAFRLRQGAPAIDAGIPSFAGVDAPPTDADGFARPEGDAFDIGAYEGAP